MCCTLTIEDSARTHCGSRCQLNGQPARIWRCVDPFASVVADNGQEMRTDWETVNEIMAGTREFSGVVNVLGECRPITRRYADGSIECPFCCYPHNLESCPNPQCEANPRMPAAAITERREQARKQKEEAEQRRRNAEWQREYHRQNQAAAETWRAEQVEEANRRGACLRCLFQAGWQRVKFVRHRGACPKA